MNGQTHTIGRLARRFGLSRSTLLYYDSIGLLKPSARMANDYRHYDEADAARLDRICTYRRAGLPLEEIKTILDSPVSRVTQALQTRLNELNDDIRRLRDQQRFIVGIMKNDSYYRHVDGIKKDVWLSILRAAGASEEDTQCWHAEFERLAPDKHHRFLEYLCMEEDDIEQIRSKSRGQWRLLVQRNSTLQPEC